MKLYIINRILQLIPLLFGITLISFFIMHLAPGDPTQLFINPNVSPEELIRIRSNWGLDQPIFIQYFYWLKNAICGNFGVAYIINRPVMDVILEKLPATLLLTGTVFILELLIAIPLGVISAVKKNSWFDNFVTIFTFAGMAIPSFWVALILILVFSLKLGWFPAGGMLDPLANDTNFISYLINISKHLTLPVISMVVVGLAGLTRYQRASMLEIIKEDFIRTARAKGMPESVVIFKHALRNAVIPIVTLLGLSLPDLFSGAFIAETIFAWPGMGRLGVYAVFSRNYPLIMGIVVISSVLIVLGNLFADIGYSLVDPRIRYGKK